MNFWERNAFYLMLAGAFVLYGIIGIAIGMIDETPPAEGCFFYGHMATDC